MTNPGFSSSWGLIFDLGDEIPAETVQALNQAIWSRPEFEGPEQKMGQFQGSFRAAEGHLTLAAQSAKTYTKFEQDSIGYPPGWQVPLSLHISLYKMAPALPENPDAQAFLKDLAADLLQIVDYRMAIIGDLGMFYCHADMITPDWLNLQQESVLQLIMSNSHPLTRQVSGQPFGSAHSHYTQAQLKPFWTEEEHQTRYLHYKHKISEAMHSQTLRLEWESPETEP